MLTPHTLTCEYLTKPLGLDVCQPRLSWKSRAEQRGARQTAYQLVVVENPTRQESSIVGQTPTNLLWDSGKITSDVSIHVPYAGTALQPGQRCDWRVRVWDEHDTVSAWS